MSKLEFYSSISILFSVLVVHLSMLITIDEFNEKIKRGEHNVLQVKKRNNQLSK